VNKNQKIALAERDLQVKDLARILDKHANYISNVLSGRHKPPALRKKICSILGKSETHLWPTDNT
jgi:plasmid maintenance system antidote protein VapI